MNDFDLGAKLEHCLQGTWSGAKRVQGIQGGAKAYVLSLVAEKSCRPMLIIAPTTSDAENLYDDLGFFLGEERSLPPFRKRLHLFHRGKSSLRETIAPSGQCGGPSRRTLQTRGGAGTHTHSDSRRLVQKVIPKEQFKRSYLTSSPGKSWRVTVYYNIWCNGVSRMSR
jgi:hypothetical protein